MVTERHPRVTATRPKILVTRRLPEAVEQRMATLFEARFNPADAPYSADALVAALAGSDVLVSSITDNIDIEAAYAAGLTVTNTPSVLTEDTADMAMLLMLALPRRLVEGAAVLPR